jgi:apolipoprotein D and lipocalin family protein
MVELDCSHRLSLPGGLVLKSSILAAVLFFSQIFTVQVFAVPTVGFVDLNNYIGRWYEVASIPASFQKKCVKNTSAEYRILDFGRIDVINSCEKSNGTLNIANGIAHVVNKTTQAELKVSFVPLVGFFGWFAGQYKILALGEKYEYSVVGTDSLEYGWILSRTPSLPLQTLIDLERKITAVGYDSCRFLTSIQDGGSSTRLPLCKVVR